MATIESSTTLNELKTMVSEDYEIEEGIADVEFSYLPTDLIKTLGSPLINIINDRQLKSFVGYAWKNSSLSLCVTFTAIVDNKKNKVNIELSKEPSGEDDCKLPDKSDDFLKVSKQNDDFKSKLIEAPLRGDDGVKSGNEEDIHNEARFWLVDSVKKEQHFLTKNVLKATLEICAMKFNFDYKVVKSTLKLWYIRCKDNTCNWTVRAECIEGCTYFKINKYMAEHTCAPSRKKYSRKTASAKTIGTLIQHKYEGVKEGPKPNDIIQIMCTENGCEISYSQVWESREYAVNAVRGIPEKSYGRIPKYLHMLKEANPGTHTHYKTDRDGRFKYLFVSFGQSVRGFYKVIRRVIVVDGTFLKSKYKGFLLVATALDGNSNLYQIAFGVVDSENDRSWEWFLTQLKVVIVDDQGLAFVSDRCSSIAKGLGNVYPRARHGICIHHLLNNVVTNQNGKGLAGLIAKASKAYRVADFEKLFNNISNISPGIGAYLTEADVTKWARCQFPGFRYDIRTNNPAESINVALRAPREYPVIPLLDSIREMLTRWFYKRKILSSKHNAPLTIEVEKKIDRRIEKGKTFSVYPVNSHRFLVKGDVIDCLVDLERRTCSYGKYDLLKIPCRHAIKAAFSVKQEIHPHTDERYTSVAWRTAYKECINPIVVPEDAWCVPLDVEHAKVLPPESRRAAGRRRKRRYETVEDKIRSQGSQRSKRYKCSRCGLEGHNRGTCDIAI